MKIFLYLLAGLALIVVAIFGWAYWYISIPDLDLPAGATETEKLEKIDAYLADLHERNQFNGDILIARAGRPLLMKAYGYTDHTATQKLTTQSAFRLASVSKQFTAAGILVLVEQGKIDLDRPVADYLTGFPYPEVRVRHLLNHTSGVPDSYMDLAEEHRSEVGDTLSIAEVVKLVVNHGPPAEAAPGDAYVYSNTNYVLLAGLVETVSGTSFENFMQAQLFTPLGMKNSRVWNLLSTDSSFPNQTGSFQKTGSKRRELAPEWIDGVAGDGAVFSSVEDFLIWDGFWRANPLLSPDLPAEAFRKPVLNDGTTSPYGFGWIITKDGMTHNGAWLGARTFIRRFTTDDSCLVLLDNSASMVMDDVAAQVLKFWD